MSRADALPETARSRLIRTRYANFIRTIGSTVFRDVPPEELLRFNNHLAQLLKRGWP
jgi:hypothetical protein